MIPAFATSAAVDLAGCSISNPPPRFRPLGTVTNARLQPCEYIRSRGMTAAQNVGLRYEARVQKAMKGLFPNYMPGPVLTFWDGGQYRSLRPDGLLVLPDAVFVFEIKIQHMPEAWWQLKLYRGVLETLFHRPLCSVEIVQSYDPSMPFPCPVTRIEDIADWTAQPRNEFGVWTWKS